MEGGRGPSCNLKADVQPGLARAGTCLDPLASSLILPSALCPLPTCTSIAPPHATSEPAWDALKPNSTPLGGRHWPWVTRPPGVRSARAGSMLTKPGGASFPCSVALRCDLFPMPVPVGSRGKAGRALDECGMVTLHPLEAPHLGRVQAFKAAI